MRWQLSSRADPHVVPVADRHYSRQKIGSPQFVPPGRCIVLKIHRREKVKAYWVSSWPLAQYVRHAWAGCWMCTAFRNEGCGLSSLMIREAVALTRGIWGDPPESGMVTFVDEDKTRPKATPGRCFIEAGFKHVGFTKGGLWVFQMKPSAMPEAQAAHRPQKRERDLFSLSPHPAAEGRAEG